MASIGEIHRSFKHFTANLRQKLAEKVTWRINAQLEAGVDARLLSRSPR